MSKTTLTNTEKDVKNAENESLKKEGQEATNNEYTIKEITDILIQRIIERWRTKNE